MSWKEGLLIYMMICVLLVACLARHFFTDVVFIAEHVIASGLLHSPALLHLTARPWL
jgi:hypothetical protein